MLEDPWMRMRQETSLTFLPCLVEQLAEYEDVSGQLATLLQYGLLLDIIVVAAVAVAADTNTYLDSKNIRCYGPGGRTGLLYWRPAGQLGGVDGFPCIRYLDTYPGFVLDWGNRRRPDMRHLLLEVHMHMHMHMHPALA